MNTTQRTQSREDAINSMAHAFEAAEASARADFEDCIDSVTGLYDTAEEVLEEALRWAQSQANSTFMNTASGQFSASGFTDQVRAHAFVKLCGQLASGMRRKSIIAKIEAAMKEAA